MAIVIVHDKKGGELPVAEGRLEVAPFDGGLDVEQPLAGQIYGVDVLVGVGRVGVAGSPLEAEAQVHLARRPRRQFPALRVFQSFVQTALTCCNRVLQGRGMAQPNRKKPLADRVGSISS